MDAFFANGDRYNLLNSAVLEMVEFIRKENLKVCVCCLCEEGADGYGWAKKGAAGSKRGAMAVKVAQCQEGADSRARERIQHAGSICCAVPSTGGTMTLTLASCRVQGSCGA
jgi:hypothetical protein